MSTEQILLDSINILAEKAASTTTQIYSGVVKVVDSNTRVTMSINGRTNTVQCYGAPPSVGTTYRVFVPNNNMSQAFIITGGSSLPPVTSDDDGKILKVVNGVWTAANP